MLTSTHNGGSRTALVLKGVYRWLGGCGPALEPWGVPISVLAAPPWDGNLRSANTWLRVYLEKCAASLDCC